MSYQTVQHFAASPKEDLGLFSDSGGRRSWSNMSVPGGALAVRKWLLGVSGFILFSALAISGCTDKDSDGQTSQQKDSASSKTVRKEVGEASWYGPGFHGQETASGETYDQTEMTAAHPSLPMGTKAKVTNLENNKKVEVIINDRGPYAEGRVIDLSRAAAKKLDMKEDGTAQVKIETKKTKKKGRSAR